MTYQERVRQFYMEKRGSIPDFETAADIDFEEVTEVEDAVSFYEFNPGSLSKYLTSMQRSRR